MTRGDVVYGVVAHVAACVPTRSVVVSRVVTRSQHLILRFFSREEIESFKTTLFLSVYPDLE